MGLSRIGDGAGGAARWPRRAVAAAGAAGPAFRCSAISTRSAAITRPRAMRFSDCPPVRPAQGGGDFATPGRPILRYLPRRARTADLAARAWPRHRRGGRDDRKSHPPSHQGRTGAAGLRGKRSRGTQDPRCAAPARVPSGRRAALTPVRATPAEDIPLPRHTCVGEHRRAKQLEAFLERKAGPCDELPWCRLRDMLSSQPGRASKIWPSSNAPAATSITPIRAPAAPAAATSASLLPRCRSRGRQGTPAPVRRRACGCRARPRDRGSRRR